MPTSYAIKFAKRPSPPENGTGAKDKLPIKQMPAIGWL